MYWKCSINVKCILVPLIFVRKAHQCRGSLASCTCRSKDEAQWPQQVSSPPLAQSFTYISLSSGQNGDADMETGVQKWRSGAAAALWGKGGGAKLLEVGARNAMPMKFWRGFWRADTPRNNPAEVIARSLKRRRSWKRRSRSLARLRLFHMKPNQLQEGIPVLDAGGVTRVEGVHQLGTFVEAQGGGGVLPAPMQARGRIAWKRGEL